MIGHSSPRWGSILRALLAAATAGLVTILVMPLPVAAAGDADRDGLTNTFETVRSHTDPDRADTDRNGVLDPAEDPDGDGLEDLGEQHFGTDPLDPDTDRDGITDGEDDANGNGSGDAAEQDRRPVPRDLRPSLAAAPDDTPPSYADHCHSLALDSRIHPCVYGDPRGHATIALFGDSHVEQWLAALIPPAAANGWRIVVLSKSACPSIGVRLKVTDLADVAPCHRWRGRAVAWLGSHRPDVVLISNYRGYLLMDGSGYLLGPAQSAAAWRMALEETLGSLPDTSKAIVLTDGPSVQADVPLCLAAHRNRISACETPRSMAIDPDHVAAEMTAAAEMGASFANLNAAICPADPCPVIAGRFLMWRAGSHLTATYARQLASPVEAMISAVLSPAAAGGPIGAGSLVEFGLRPMAHTTEPANRRLQ